MKIANFSHNGILYKGYSEGGIYTSIIVPSWNAMFDMGNTYAEQVQYDHLFLTHPHMDHFAGVPFYISQRSLRNLKPPKIFVPPHHLAGIDRIMEIYSELEDFQYKYELISAEIGRKYELKNNLFIVPLPTYHRVVSQGYTVFERKSKLKAEYIGYTRQELVEIKSNGNSIEQFIEYPIFSYSGDTKIEYVLNHEPVRNSKVLFLECTYLDENRDVQRAREWGHIHLDEIIEHADCFQNERIVLIHFSPRFRYQEIREKIKKKLPSSLVERIHLFLPEQNNLKKSPNNKQ